MDYLHIVLTSVASVVVLFILTKLMGYRQMSQMSMFDYINGITIGSIAAEMAISLEGDFKIPLTAMVVYGAVAVFLSWLGDKFIFCHRFLVGRAYVLFQKDEFVYDNLKKAHINVNEFLTASRAAGYFDISQLQCAVLEPNGQISFLPKAEARPVNPRDINITPQEEYLFSNVIIDGKVMERNLKNAGRDRNWLNKQLKQHNISSVKDVYLGVCDCNDECYFFKKDNRQDVPDRLD